jgi:hypothetical protein
MASLELSPLADQLEDDEIKDIVAALREVGASPDLDDNADSHVLDRGLDDDIFADFFDRLDANDIACDIYVPAEFEESFEVRGYKIGSAHALALFLDELKEDLFVEDDDAEEDEFAEDFDEFDEEEGDVVGDDADDAIELKDQAFRHLWKLMHRGAKTAMTRGVCMFVHPNR